MSEERFDRLEAQINGFVAEIRSEVAEMKENTQKWDERFETYQKANQSIVNLAFSLIASATVVTIASALFSRR